jgi:t-SNARE complex subunit (syntaxin)
VLGFGGWSELWCMLMLEGIEHEEQGAHSTGKVRNYEICAAAVIVIIIIICTTVILSREE